MKRKDIIETLIDEAISSADGAAQATPKPFLLTRINARLAMQNENDRGGFIGLIGRPYILVTGLLLVICFNITAIIIHKSQPVKAIEQSMQTQADEFSYSVATIYDIENNE